MPQISEKDFERLPLRAHRFLAGVPLHDVWVVDLPSPRAGITLDEFLRVASERIYTPTPAVRRLLDLRLLIGRLFGWDRPRTSTQAAPTFADRLTDADGQATTRFEYTVELIQELVGLASPSAQKRWKGDDRRKA